MKDRCFDCIRSMDIKGVDKVYCPKHKCTISANGSCGNFKAQKLKVNDLVEKDKEISKLKAELKSEKEKHIIGGIDFIDRDGAYIVAEFSNLSPSGADLLIASKILHMFFEKATKSTCKDCIHCTEELVCTLLDTSLIIGGFDICKKFKVIEKKEELTCSNCKHLRLSQDKHEYICVEDSKTYLKVSKTFTCKDHDKIPK